MKTETEQKVEKEMPLRLEGAHWELCRTGGHGTFWDGTSWVTDYQKALQYAPTPSEEFHQASLDCARFNEAGVKCVVLFFHSVETETSERDITQQQALAA